MTGFMIICCTLTHKVKIQSALSSTIFLINIKRGVIEKLQVYVVSPFNFDKKYKSNSMLAVRNILFIVVAIIISGCSVSIQNTLHKNYQDKESTTKKLKKIVVIEPNISIKEFGMTATEEVPDWTKESKAHLTAALKKYFGLSESNTSVVFNPKFNDKNQKIIDQHIALYNLVASNNLYIRAQKGFEQELIKPDDTVGSGINLIKKQTGADALLIISGEDLVPSPERIASFAAFALMGVAIPMGGAYLNSGFIDLETGDIIWSNTQQTSSYRDKSGANSALESTLKTFPKHLL